MQRAATDRAHRGFTLIELLTALAVAAILLSVAVPAFAELQRRARSASAYSDLTLSLAAARLLAVRLGEPVSMCPSVDGRHCADSTDWSQGWIVFADPGRDEQPATASAIRHRGEGVAGTLVVRSTSGRKLVRFQPTGWAYGSNLSLRLCSRVSGRLLGKVILNNAGRPRTERLEDTSTGCPYPV
jgi:type IV fimbrial biogenesis protein FimT